MRHRRHHLRTLGLAALLATILAACTAPVPNETLASFELLLPANADYGLPFELTVRAVGSGGSAPLTGFDGPVTLTSDRGLLTDTGFELLDTLDLTDGVGSVQAVALGDSGDVTLTAAAGAASGSATIEIAPLTALPGDPGDPAEDAIPDLPLIPRDEDYSDDHPELPGVFISPTTLALVLELGTTVGEANALLAAEGAEIVGGVAGEGGVGEGVLILRLPTTDHPQMIARIAALLAETAVKFAVQDSVLDVLGVDPEEAAASRIEPAALPRPNGGTPAGWSWELTPTGGNWGLERIRMPQAWNLNAALEKRHPTVATRPTTGILDAGFTDPRHSDVNWSNQSPTSISFHGVHVAGIIHATHDNGAGVDGVNPFTTLRVRDFRLVPGSPVPGGSPLVRGRSFGVIVTGEIPLFIARNPGLRVINASLGYPWTANQVETNTSLPAQQLASQQGGVLAAVLAGYGKDAPVFTVASGNESNDIQNGAGVFITQPARWASPFNNAAIEHNAFNIVVVESTTITGARSSFSNPGGTVSAPGSAVLSTSIPHSHGSTNHAGNFSTEGGTSMAAPHVAGLVGFLYALDPDLSHLQIRSLLSVNGRTVTGGASDEVDAFASALDIDRVRGNSAVLQMLLDIDDGTPDGNQRTVIGSVGAGSDGDGDGLADDALDTDGPLIATPTDFEGEDADADGGQGDGQIDMADFRRWRDWLLQIENDGALSLDGSNSNGKRDVNDDNRVQGAAKENVFPRGDFNGDGVLDRSATSFVPGAVGAGATDLGVLENLFNDPFVDADDLEGLIDSMDLTVWPKSCFGLDAYEVASVTSGVHPQRVINAALDPALFTRPATSIVAPDVYTLALLSSAAPQGYTARLEALDGDGEIVGIAEMDLPGDAPLDLGGDVLFDGCDPKPLLSAIAASVDTVVADATVEVDFDLTFEDAGENLESVRTEFILGGDVAGAIVATTDIDDPSITGMDGAAQGGGTITFDVTIFCSETGENPLTVAFTLFDEMDQVSEELTVDIPVDYSGCPSTVREDATHLVVARGR
jgi:hypothetical protein